MRYHGVGRILDASGPLYTQALDQMQRLLVKAEQERLSGRSCA